jgi:3-oxoacyl-[acyl-carrier protein] reductase
MDLGLKGARVLVSGGSRGIGLAIARAFAAEGARLAIAARGAEQLGVAARGLATDPPVLELNADMTQDEDVRRAVARAEAALGGIDIYIANVGSGVFPAGPFRRDDWERCMATNLFGAASLAGLAAERLKSARNGSLIFVSSIAGLEAIGAPAAYAAAKAALQALVKTMARELGPHGVRVNAVAPGNVLFEGGSWERKLQEDAERVNALIRSEVPLQRFAAPAEIADVVVFLASPRAAFVTGATWVVDGGQTRGFR